MSAVRYYLMVCFMFICLLVSAEGYALPYVPVLGSIVSAAPHERSYAAGTSSFLISHDTYIRNMQSLPSTASFPSGKAFVPASLAGPFQGAARGQDVDTPVNDRIFDLLIPLFAGSILIGFAGIIRKLGAKPVQTKRFARMNAEAPYKKAVTS